MIVPRYRRDPQTTKQRGVNLVASWRGQTRLFVGCSERATAAFCSMPSRSFAAIIQFGRNQAAKGFQFPILAR
jgi:hypothetical protein